MNNSEFDKHFEEAFSCVGKNLYDKYKNSIDTYRNHIIPFETKRMKENQSISFKNTSLERDKFELLSKIEQLTSENQRHEYVLEKQQIKIS